MLIVATGFAGCSRVMKFNESETSWSSSLAICHNLDIANLSKLVKVLFQISLRGVLIQAAHKALLGIDGPSARASISAASSTAAAASL